MKWIGILDTGGISHEGHGRFIVVDTDEQSVRQALARAMDEAMKPFDDDRERWLAAHCDDDEIATEFGSDLDGFARALDEWYGIHTEQVQLGRAVRV